MSVLEKAVTSWLEKRPYLEEVAAFALSCEHVLDGGRVLNELPANLDNVKEELGQGIPLLLTKADFKIEDAACENLLMFEALKDEVSLPENTRNQAAKLKDISSDDAKILVKTFTKVIDKDGAI